MARSAVADRLLRAHRRHGFEHLVIVASDELQPVVEHSLHTELKDVLAGTVPADLEHATVQEIERAIAPVIESSERDRERTLVATVEQGLGTGGAAAAGLDEVLAMLEQHRVDTLLVPEQSTLVAGVCPQCGRLSDADDLRCPLDGAALSEVDAVEHAVEAAAAQSRSDCRHSPRERVARRAWPDRRATPVVIVTVVATTSISTSAVLDPAVAHLGTPSISVDRRRNRPQQRRTRP